MHGDGVGREDVKDSICGVYGEASRGYSPMSSLGARARALTVRTTTLLVFHKNKSR